MSRSTYSVTQAQSALPRLVREAEEGELVAITRRDETVAYLLSRDHLEAIVESLVTPPSSISGRCSVWRNRRAAGRKNASSNW